MLLVIQLQCGNSALLVFAAALTPPVTITQNCGCCEILAFATVFPYNADQLTLHNTHNMTQKISFVCKTYYRLCQQSVFQCTSFSSTVLTFLFGACLGQQLKSVVQKSDKQQYNNVFI